MKILPLDPLDAITTAPLTYFIDLLDYVLQPEYLPTLLNLTNRPDSTYFCANGPGIAQFAQSQSSEPTAKVVQAIEYITVPGTIIYSPSLTDGLEIPTVAGINLTITKYNRSTYVNNAKIIENDILISNGVIHVIDTHLNASDPGARPQMTTNVPNVAATPSGPSTGAEEGIGVGAAVSATVVIGALVVLFRKRQANDSSGDSASASADDSALNSA